MIKIKGIRSIFIATLLLLNVRLAVADENWLSAGKDLYNSRHQSDERIINSRTARNLKPLWNVVTSGDVTATPTIDGKYIYFPDSAGFLYKVARDDGAIVWKLPISTYTGIVGDYARATPAVAGNALILGNSSGHFLGPGFGTPAPQPAQVFAVDKRTGEKLWSTQVDPTALSFVTHSALVAEGLAIVGVASNEELVAGFVPKRNWQWNSAAASWLST